MAIARADPGSDPRAAGPYYVDVRSGWTGWIGFAASMLLLIGTFHAIAGFVGIFKDDYFAVSQKDLLVTVDYTAWGWTHLAFGLVAIVAAFGLLRGSMWARVLAVVFAILSAIVNLGFINAYPLWSTMIIVFDVLVIWAVTVHGAEMKSPA